MSESDHDPLAFNDRRQIDALTQYRLQQIEKNLEAITRTMQDNAESMKLLVSLEQKHTETRESMARAFIAIDEQEKQIRAIEQEMPALKMVRNWVIAGVVGVFAIFGTQVVRFVAPNTQPVELTLPKGHL